MIKCTINCCNLLRLFLIFISISAPLLSLSTLFSCLIIPPFPLRPHWCVLLPPLKQNLKGDAKAVSQGHLTFLMSSPLSGEEEGHSVTSHSNEGNCCAVTNGSPPAHTCFLLTVTSQLNDKSKQVVLIPQGGCFTSVHLKSGYKTTSRSSTAYISPLPAL